jgi:hypothetical protein
MYAKGKIMKFKSFGTVLICLLLAACSDPKDYKLPEKISTTMEDAELTKKVFKLSEEERKLLGGYAARELMAESLGTSVGKADTIGEAIAVQQIWLSEQTERIAAEETKEAALLKIGQEMHAAIVPEVTSFEYKKMQRENHFNLGISFKNNSNSEIIGIKGEIIISDLFDVTLKKSVISTVSNIKSGGELSGVWRLAYNHLTKDDETLKIADATKLRFVWNPQTYIFADGRKLSLIE